MSKVDMSVFEELFTALGVEADSRTYYELFNEEQTRWLDNLTAGKETEEEVEQVLQQFGCERMLEGEYGEEGEGEHCWSVIKLKDKFYRASWSYYSYDGCEYDYIADTIEEVIPVEKTVIVYESVK